jgi:hypothetical protein
VAVAHDTAEDFKNVRISWTLYNNRVLRCLTTLETAQCLLGVGFAGLAFAEGEDEDGDPNVEAFRAGCSRGGRGRGHTKRKGPIGVGHAVAHFVNHLTF